MPEEIFVSFAWDTGETRRLTREFSRSRPNSPFLSTQTAVTLTATSVTPERIRLLWEYGEAEVDGVDDQTTAAFLQRLTPPQIQYSLNDIGEFEGITNVAELRTYIDSALEVLEGEAVIDQAASDQLRSTYRNMTDEQFSAAFAEEILTFHYFDGMTARVGGTETFDGDLPSPFGGPPFDAVFELTTASEFDSEGCATLSLVSVPNPETTPSILREIVGDMVGEDLTDEELFENFNVRNEITLQLDVATSQVRRVTTNQRITSLGQQAEDIKIITYLD